MIRALAPTELAPYLGKEFEWRGRGPDRYDCWGLVRAIYADCLGIDLPSGIDDYPAMDDKAARGRLLQDGQDGWRAIVTRGLPMEPLTVHAAPQSGDVVLMRRGQWLGHVGLLVVDATRPLSEYHWELLHIEEGTEVTKEPISRRYSRQVMGVYRWGGDLECLG